MTTSSTMFLALLTSACGALPATQPVAPQATENEVANEVAVAPLEPPAEEAPPPGPLRWQDYDCRVSAGWQPGPSLDARAAPADAEASDVVGWYAEGRVGRLFRWRARGAAMGELRWLRWEGGAWVESGSGAWRWPRTFDAESHDSMVVVAPRFAILAHRGGADQRFLDTMWLVRDSAPPRRLRFGHADEVGGAIVTATGEAHLHLSGLNGEQLFIHFAADGAEIARRTVQTAGDEATGRSLGVTVDGLIEAIDGGSRLHSYDPSTPPASLSLVPHFLEPYTQLASGSEPCPTEEGLRFAAYGLGQQFAAVDIMSVTYEVRGTGTCVRAVRVPLYAPGGDLDCERCDVMLDARDGSLIGSALRDDGFTREVRCTPAPGSPELYPIERARAEGPEP